MARRVHFGVMLPMWSYNVYEDVSFAQVAAMARDAERLGYDYVSSDDHLQRGDGRALDSLTSLAALAAQTTRVRLRTTVLSAMFRPPSLVAKMAANIDVISGGRLELGIGAGWKQEEADAYGLAWDGAKGRLDRLEEACQVILALWTQEEATFTGRHFRLQRAKCAPPPVQRPHPPLWIGGGGERRTLRIAAAYADGVDFAAPGIGHGGPLDPLEYFVHKRQVLHAHCRDVKRDPAAVALAAGVNIVLWGRSRAAVEARLASAAAQPGLSEGERQRMGALRGAVETAQEAIATIERYVQAGATHIMLSRPAPEGLQRFAREVMPHFRA